MEDARAVVYMKRDNSTVLSIDDIIDILLNPDRNKLSAAGPEPCPFSGEVYVYEKHDCQKFDTLAWHNAGRKAIHRERGTVMKTYYQAKEGKEKLNLFRNTFTLLKEDCQLVLVHYYGNVIPPVA